MDIAFSNFIGIGLVVEQEGIYDAISKAVPLMNIP